MPQDRLKTLYLDGNGVGRTIIFVDDVRRSPSGKADLQWATGAAEGRSAGHAPDVSS